MIKARRLIPLVAFVLTLGSLLWLAFTVGGSVVGGYFDFGMGLGLEVGFGLGAAFMVFVQPPGWGRQ